MLKHTFKTLVLSFLMFAFIGQAMGYSTFNSCQETSTAHNANFNSSDIISFNTNSFYNDLSISAESKSNSKAETQDVCCNDNCCDNECICIANGCAAAMNLNTILNFPNTQFFNDPAYIPYLAKLRSINSAFFRPPISIS